MKLTPREVEKLMLHDAGYLAQKRLARGLRLNYTEAVALIATQSCDEKAEIDRCDEKAKLKAELRSVR
ncbi:hypothetical protein LOK49_LG10G00180 [Camellia lanceoleosa]|uniref:Uncharacterized protein n=1 Tax=Camellia lanceoleosa TaxID=1840588 RepID=A0ACC0G6X6_9ERIC|nr:hypothetical protein LOK49_LG10G00180 [Camellia lanceoleosa]